jgi:hypothetical protein
MRVILLLTLVVLTGFGAELPAAAKSAVEKYDAALEKISTAANAAASKEKEKLLAELSKQLSAETKKGNFESAVAINSKITALTDAGIDVLGNVVPEKAVLGVWTVSKEDGFKGRWYFSPDKTVVVLDNQGRAMSGEWSVEDKCVRVFWNGHKEHWDSLTFPITDECSGDSWNTKAGTLKAVRIK